MQEGQYSQRYAVEPLISDRIQPPSSNQGESYISDAMQMALEDAEAHQMVA